MAKAEQKVERLFAQGIVVPYRSRSVGITFKISMIFPPNIKIIKNSNTLPFIFVKSVKALIESVIYIHTKSKPSDILTGIILDNRAGGSQNEW